MFNFLYDFQCRPNSKRIQDATTMSQMMEVSASKNRLHQYKTAEKNIRHKYGPVKIPEVHPQFFKRRQYLNNLVKFDCDRNISDNIVLSDEMKVVYKSKVQKSVIKVEDEKGMISMCNHLKNQVEIGIDTEFDTTHFYHDIIAVIQISSHELDFLIDPLKVFPFIKPLLEPILLSKNILKLVFSQYDVLACQRDYNVFFESTVDVQEVSNHYFNSKEINYDHNVSLAKAV